MNPLSEVCGSMESDPELLNAILNELRVLGGFKNNPEAFMAIVFGRDGEALNMLNACLSAKADSSSSATAIFMLYRTKGVVKAETPEQQTAQEEIRARITSCFATRNEYRNASSNDSHY